jgi:1-acyl-sn-glycerol-3-phosphate acyltransferase
MANKETTRKLSAWLFTLAHLTILPYLNIKYRIRGKNKKIFKTVKPPFVLLPNHVSMFDPPMVNIFVPFRIHFVMSDANLRSKFGKWVFGKHCNVISKTKVISDSSAVRKIVQLARKKRVICIFPEGRSSWDGVTHDIYFSTSKLLKVLKIPVIVPLIRGGYLTQPRWATSVRPGKMHIEYKKVFDGPELGRMTPHEIHKKLVDELWHDDYHFQRTTGQKYHTKRGAEYLERLLFICPECHSKTTLHSDGNTFLCTSCGFETLYTPEGLLKPVESGKHPDRTITDWVNWQNAFFEKTIREMAYQKSIDPIFVDKEITLLTGERLEPLKIVTEGTMALYLDRFTITDNNGRIINFPIEKIEGVQVLLSNKFEFYFQDAVYKFQFKDPRTSGYKYMCAIQKIAPEKTELE